MLEMTCVCSPSTKDHELRKHQDHRHTKLLCSDDEVRHPVYEWRSCSTAVWWWWNSSDQRCLYNSTSLCCRYDGKSVKTQWIKHTHTHTQPISKMSTGCRRTSSVLSHLHPPAEWRSLLWRLTGKQSWRPLQSSVSGTGQVINCTVMWAPDWLVMVDNCWNTFTSK